MGGAPGPSLVNQVSLEYTSTQSIFTFDVAGKVTLTVTFLSPVYPDDMGRQSQQFSYIVTKAKSSDGAAHNVQVYMDVSGGMCPSSTPHSPVTILLIARTEWASGDVGQVVTWDVGNSGDIIYHKFQRQNQEQFKEAGEIASWGNWYLATRSDKGVSNPGLLLTCVEGVT